MMPLLVDVGTYVASNTTLVVGTTLFEGQMPAEVDAGVCLTEYGSEPPDFVLSSAGVYLERPRFQAYCRHTDYATGRAMIDALYLALSQVVNQTLTATVYLRIEPLQSPFQVTPPRDAQGRWEWFCNFRAEKEPG